MACSFCALQPALAVVCSTLLRLWLIPCMFCTVPACGGTLGRRPVAPVVPNAERTWLIDQRTCNQRPSPAVNAVLCSLPLQPPCRGACSAAGPLGLPAAGNAVASKRHGAGARLLRAVAQPAVPMPLTGHACALDVLSVPATVNLHPGRPSCLFCRSGSGSRRRQWR